VVYRNAGKSCPRCGIALENEVSGPREFHRCQSCFGVWLTHSTLKDMLSEMGADAPIGLGPSHDDGHDLHCPDCKKAMAKGTAFGMPIDVCPNQDGLWFDRDELEKSLAGAGGVEPLPEARSELSLLQRLMRGELD